MIRKSHKLLAAVLGMVLGAGSATVMADPGLPVYQPPFNPVQVNPVQIPNPVEMGQPLTGDTMVWALQQMGYQPQMSRADDGSPIATITFYDGTFKIVMDTQLSTDGKVLWLIGRLSVVNNPEAVPAQALLAMLQQNTTNGKVHFSYNTGYKQFCLEFPLENDQAMTPARLRTGIATLTQKIEKTSPLWSNLTIARGNGGFTPAPAPTPVNGGYIPTPVPVNGGYAPMPVNGGYTPAPAPVNGGYTPTPIPVNGNGGYR